MMNGIKEIAESVGSELKHRLPKQRKTQRTKLALLVSTMLEVRSGKLFRQTDVVAKDTWAVSEGETDPAEAKGVGK